MLGTGHFDRQGSKIISRRGHCTLYLPFSGKFAMFIYFSSLAFSHMS